MLKKIVACLFLGLIFIGCLTRQPLSEYQAKVSSPVKLCENLRYDDSYKVASDELKRRKISVDACAQLMRAETDRKRYEDSMFDDDFFKKK